MPPLVLSGTPPATVIAGRSYSFKPSVSGGSSGAIRYTIVGQPKWASFNRTDGRLSGTPTAANIGTSAGISIAATDGHSVAMLPAFSITVAGVPNAAPAISGTPPTTATVGKSYTFTPKASDANGDALKFSAQNLPKWGSFSTKNGTLAGTPTAAGTWSGIVIAVSDGKATVAMPAFSITASAPVSQPAAPATSSVTLAWQRPNANVDGTTLVDLAGYRIVYGTDPANLATTLLVPGASTTSATIEGLAAGTYYFAVKAYTTSGLESVPSGIASKTF